MTLVVEENEPAGPRRVGLLRPPAIVASPDGRADAVQKARLAGGRQRSLADKRSHRRHRSVDDPWDPIHDGRSIDERPGPAKMSPTRCGRSFTLANGSALHLIHTRAPDRW